MSTPGGKPHSVPQDCGAVIGSCSFSFSLIFGTIIALASSSIFFAMEETLPWPVIQARNCSIQESWTRCKISPMQPHLMARSSARCGASRQFPPGQPSIDALRPPVTVSWWTKMVTCNSVIAVASIPGLWTEHMWLHPHPLSQLHAWNQMNPEQQMPKNPPPVSELPSKGILNPMEIMVVILTAPM